MERYDSYKDSGVEWIGEIPNSWRKLKIKHLFSHSKGKNGQKLTKEFIGNNPGEYPVYSGTTKGEGHLGRTNEYEFDTYGEEVIFVSTVGSDTTVMSTKVLSGRFNLSQNCLIMSPKFDFSTKYQYYFTTHDFPYQRTILPIVLKEGHRSVGMGELNEFTSLLPPLSEQQQIVSFLDTKTSLIDSLIEKTQRKIELLKEKRTSLINEVVTKGLNPNVEMKDSGVEWIGDIPSSWSSGKIKYFTEIISKGTTPSTIGKDVLDEGPVIYIKVENIKESTVDFPPKCFIDKETDELLSRSKLIENDILVVITGSTTGKVVILPKEFTPSNTNQGISFIRLKNKSNENVRYVWYWLISEKIQNQIKTTYTQSTQPNLSMELMGNFYIPVPNEDEKIKIVEFLDEHTQLIDKTISIEEKRIELLKEYRQSLISEVVTGKRKVV